MSDKQQQQHKRKAQQAQIKAQINRDKARRKLLQQRKKLAQRRKRNRKQSEARRDGTDDDGENGVGNPTVHSTVPPQKTNAENAARNSHSAVPPAPKYSDMSGCDRLYGLRLHQRTTSETTGSSSTSDATMTSSEHDTDGGQTDE